MLSDCLFTPSDSDEDYADAWFNWDQYKGCNSPYLFDY